MKFNVTTAVALLALAGCEQPTTSHLADTAERELAPQLGSIANDPAAPLLALADVSARVVPTLTRSDELLELEKKLAELEEALVTPNAATLRDHVAATKLALEGYARAAPAEQEPELAGIAFMLDFVSEGLPPLRSRSQDSGRESLTPAKPAQR